MALLSMNLFVSFENSINDASKRGKLKRNGFAPAQVTRRCSVFSRSRGSRATLKVANIRC